MTYAFKHYAPASAPPPYQGGGWGEGQSLTLHFNRRAERNKRRALRRAPTDAEQKLWQRLRGKQLGTRFRRQFSVDTYVLDFYAPRVKLALEVDGAAHLETKGTDHDERRTAHLKGFGIEVLRFTNIEVLQNLDGVLEIVRQAVSRRITSP